MRKILSLPLLVLALGGFGIGLTEFVIVGVLPELSRQFHVSADIAGWLVSGYAIATAIGAIVITAVTRNSDDKRVLLWLLVLFIVGNAISALAPSYEIMLVGRILSALCHGAFFGIGSVLAASQVEKQYASEAISVMFAGLTTANALGVPFGTFIAQISGWRTIFWAISIIGIFTFLGVWCFIRTNHPASHEIKTPLSTEIRLLANFGVWSTVLITGLGFAGMFGVFTYIGFTLTSVTGFSESIIPWMLVLFGGGLFLGNIAGGKFAAKKLDASLFIFLVLLTLSLIGFGLGLHSRIFSLFFLLLMGFFGFAITPGVQTRIMSFAQGAEELASGINIAAFNAGNALGAAICGTALSSTGRGDSVMYTGAIFAALAASIVIIYHLFTRKNQTHNTLPNTQYSGPCYAA